jgi:hypothetical protein
MPYIKPEMRKIIDHDIDQLVASTKSIPSYNEDKTGIFNYIITKIAVSILDKISYGEMSRIKAAMNDAADEFTRQYIIPYEVQKIHENGDVVPSPVVKKEIGKKIEEKTNIKNVISDFIQKN